MPNKIFDKNNPNHDILVVPEQFGSSDEDRYFGSIGDATMQHLNTLSNGERQMWQELILMRDGNILRQEPNFDYHDNDPLSLDGKELKFIKQELAKSGIDIETNAQWKEALDYEEERREKSEDLLDNSDRIPYHEWEKFPGLSKHVEMPKTPPPRWVYMGNTRQIFYDEFPEGHPDSKFLNQFINMVNRDNMDNGYLGWVKKQLDQTQIDSTTYYHLVQFLDKIKDDSVNIQELMKETLLDIDNDWAINYRNEVLSNNQLHPITKLMDWNEAQWEESAQKGFQVLNTIKHFGHTLFSDPDLKTQMNRHHWARYKKIKNQYANKLIFKGIDLNRCSLTTIKQVLNISNIKARNIWFNRPFQTIAELYNKGYIGKEVFSIGESTDQILEMIENTSKNKTELSDTREKIKGLQRINSLKLTRDEWKLIWSYYAIVKDTLTRQLNEQWKEKGKANV